MHLSQHCYESGCRQDGDAPLLISYLSISESIGNIVEDNAQSTDAPSTPPRRIAVVTINAPEKLNALGLAMVTQLGTALSRWAEDKSVLAVWLQGAGDKAFCAGGDIVDMYHVMKASPNVIPNEVSHYFSCEYRTDYQIHTYPKPIIVWGDGIVMGGGIGLMSGGSHRLVTERSRLAMPEISIGLYPDVGATYFLPKMPDNAGLFLGLTGAQISGRDALHLNMADHRVSAARQTQIKAGLVELPWQGNGDDFAMLSRYFREYELPDEEPDKALPTAYLAHRDLIDELCAGSSLAEVVASILRFQGGDLWLQKAQANLRSGSPITAHLVWHTIQQPPVDLVSAFQQELVLSCRCAESGEFCEGVRALLIDKDRSPQWNFATVDEVPLELIEHHFLSPWSEERHPLRDLASVS